MPNGSATGNCILVENGASVTGNVINTSGGVLTANGAAAPSRIGIAINNSTVSGSVTNAGRITASNTGILVTNNAVVSGGISNSGTINTANHSFVLAHTGILVQSVSTFAGGIANSGTLNALADGISVTSVSAFSGGISNGGTLSVAGSQGINVNFVSTFSGGITNSGTLSASGGGISVVSLSTFAGGITNTGTVRAPDFYGTLVEDVSNFSGGITNGGSLSAQVDGIRAQNVSSFAGGITNSGTVSGFVDGIALQSISTFSGGITNSGTLNSGNAGIGVVFVSTFTGNITNSGSITAATGIFVGPGVTFAAGSAIVNSGTITGTGGNAINVSGASSAITIDQNGGLISGNIMLSPNADVLNIAGGSINGDIVGAGGLDTVNFNLGSGTFTYGAPFGFHGINAVNVSSGTVILDGENNANTVNVTGGNLEVGDAANPHAILGVLALLDVTGGILSGHGTIFAPVTIDSGGTLFPGGSLGTLTITSGVDPGSLTFNAGSTYGIELTPTQHSMTVVNGVHGTVTINGGEVELTPHLGTYAPSTFAILTSSGTLTGQFDPTITYTGSLHLDNARLSYDGHDVFLSYGQTFSTLVLPAGATTNQINVATGINNFILSGGTPPAPFQTLAGLSGPSLLNALNQLDGEDATGAEKGAFQLMTQFLDLMLDPYVYGRAGFTSGGQPLGFAPDQADSLPPDIALAYDSVFKAPAPSHASPASGGGSGWGFDQRWNAWGSGFGGSATTNGDPVVGSNNVTTNTYGYAAGMDYRYSPDTVLGFSVAGGGTSWNLVQGLGTGRSDAFMAGGYGITHFGPAYVAGALAFANNWFTTNRIALGDQLTANFQGQSYAARLEGGYRFVMPASSLASPASRAGLGWGLIGITPYAAIQSQNFHTPAYSETDLTTGGFGLSYAAMNGTDTRSELGSRFDDLTAIGAMPLILRARLAWAHDWVSNPALNAAFESLPGTSFTVNGAPIPHDSALTSAGAQLFFTPNWSLLTKFDGEFASGSQTYAGTGTLRYTW